MAHAKISRIFLAATFALLAPHFALAQIVITEIMYDLPVGSDSGREWIEVYNSGPASVDLTKFRLFENETNHKIATTVGAGALAPSAYAVIADNPLKFKADWPQYSGALFDSVFNLGNAGDSLELRDASSTVLDTTSFSNALGAAGDGNSLNRSSAGEAFTPHAPSPGAAMSTDVIAPLVKAAPAPKVVAPKKSSKSTVTSPSKEQSAESGEVSEIDPSSQVAAVVTAATAPWEWWLAAGLLIIASAGAVVFARRFAKDEWDIVEDTPE